MDENAPLSEKIPETESNQKLVSSKSRFSVGIIIAVLIFFVGVLFYRYSKEFQNILRLPVSIDKKNPTQTISLKKFSSYEELKSYMETASQLQSSRYSSGIGSTQSIDKSMTPAIGTAPSTTGAESQVNRVSETNIQVEGIDEPDIVKTNGGSIFISELSPIIYKMGQVTSSVSDLSRGVVEPVPATPIVPNSTTKVLNSLPIDQIKKQAEIEKSGDLLVSGNTLIIFSSNNIYAYNILKPESPSESWKYELDQRNSIISSRLYNGKIYLVTQTTNYSGGCAIPLTTGKNVLNIACTDIFHPILSIPADSIITVLKIDAKSGNIENKNSFVGSAGESVFYMSKNNLYLTYTYSDDLINIFFNFYTTTGKDLLPQEVLTKLKNLKDMDLSSQAKYTELSVILEKYRQSLSQDELLRIENETQNKLSDYLKVNSRNIEHTEVVALSSDNLDIKATGVVSGRPLNQFSLDEYNGNLRIAQTIGGGMLGNSSINDVYILDGNLQKIGEVLDLGSGEQIYSVRFINDMGYVVTFKQTDPFYVLDLKSVSNPKKVGELKIPGYSSYLHPLDNNLILGVGDENGKVKISLFDATNPSNPIETSKYNLDEYYTQVSQTHKAFLQDKKYNAFFLPGSKGGYIFSYTGNTLKLLKAVSESGIERAIFVNDYLYLIGGSKMTILDESKWETKKTVDL